MISLRQSIRDLDEVAVAKAAAAKAFAEALEMSAAHVVEVNRGEAEEFREQVLSLAGQLSRSAELDAARSRFRGELRDYSERARQHVTRLREELVAATAAMQAFAQGVTISTGEYESVLRREFGQLKEAAEAEDARLIRAAVHETVHAVVESYEGLKQAQALVIAQLRDEIRVLHSELERGRRKAELPPGAISKRDLDREVDELLRQDRAFAVVLANVSGPKPETLAALTDLARQRVPKAAVATWGDDCYGVVVTTGVAAAEWERAVAGSVTVVEHQPGESPVSFFDRLSALTFPRRHDK